MRICVFGAGAVGGHLAARLAARGEEVSVVARGAHLEAMRANGVKLIHGDEIIRGKVNTRPSGAQDAVLVTLKANMLGAFAAAAPALVGPDTLVVFAQNGIPWWYAPRPDEPLRSMLPMHNIAGGVVYSANEVVEPGVIRNFVPGNNMLVIGSPERRDSERLRALRQRSSARAWPRRRPRTSASRCGPSWCRTSRTRAFACSPSSRSPT